MNKIDNIHCLDNLRCLDKIGKIGKMPTMLVWVKQINWVVWLAMNYSYGGSLGKTRKINRLG